MATDHTIPIKVICVITSIEVLSLCDITLSYKSIITFLIRSSRSILAMFLMFPPIILLTFFGTIRNLPTSLAFISLLLPTHPASRPQCFNIRIIIDRLRISKNSHFLPFFFRHQIPQRSRWFNVRGGEQWCNCNAGDVRFKNIPSTSGHNRELSSNFSSSAGTD
jgi:hypothetical protein